MSSIVWANNETGPFNLTVGLVLLVSVYMVLGPAHWLKKLMQVSKMSLNFEIFLLVLGIVYLVIGWIFERHVSQRLARALGRVKEGMTRATKKRKEYKVIEERMRT